VRLWCVRRPASGCPASVRQAAELLEELELPPEELPGFDEDEEEEDDDDGEEDDDEDDEEEDADEEELSLLDVSVAVDDGFAEPLPDDEPRLSVR
jgi:hypothetical protein